MTVLTRCYSEAVEYARIAHAAQFRKGTAETKTKLDTPEAKYADWRNRKLAYIASLEKKPIASLLVSTCDKLHNARAIVADAQGDAGLAVFERFKVGKEGTLRYYESLARASSREPLE